MATIIDGKTLSQTLREEIKTTANQYQSRYGRPVGLAVVMVGDNPASQVYVRNKIRACEEVGIHSFSYILPQETTQGELQSLIQSLVSDEQVNGILVQLPLPKHIDEKSILKLIPVEKDVDGFSEENIGKLCLNQPCLVACTPHGVMQMLKAYGIETKGKNAVVLGRSDIVGKPMAMLLCNADATVTICHSKTQNLQEICQKADILVAAIGKAKFVKAEMVKEGAVVIDVGINRNEEGKLCGDVDYDNVAPKCSFITPVPGGVGPMTITMLMYNTCLAAQRQAK